MTEEERLIVERLTKDELLATLGVVARGMEEQRTGQPVPHRVTGVRVTHQGHGLRMEATFGPEEEEQ